MKNAEDVIASLYASIPSHSPIIAKAMTSAAELIEQLRSQLTAAQGSANERNDRCGILARSADGLRLQLDAKTRALTEASDGWAECRRQLSAREAELENLQNKLHTKDEEINCAGLTNDALEAKLAAYDACLTQVREEMPGGLAAMLERYKQDTTVGTPYPMERLLEAIGYIASLQLREAANRKSS